MLRFVQRSEPYHIEGLPDWMASLLYSRGVSTKEEAEAYLRPSYEHLHDPMMMQDMERAVALIKDAISKKQRAVVYGDYDVDGMCASALLCETLKSMGLKTIVYIPDRHSEGYGLSSGAIEKLAPQAELLISVDCGITSVEEVSLAKSLGMTVILTDHHTPPDKLPNADAILSPLLGDYPFPYLCGAGVAWKLSAALKGLEFAKSQIDLAALATMADMVPLTGENRVIASYGLTALGVTKRAGLQALKEIASIPQSTKLTSDQVVFQLAPRLNAGGRLSTAADALELLQTEHPARAEALAEELDKLNTRRKSEEKDVIEAAQAQIQPLDLMSKRSIVVVGEGWNSGVIGLAAGRLAERFGYPSVVLSRDGDTCVGSARSAGEIDLFAALKTCADLFVRFGGHKQAAGLTIAYEKLDEFRERFDIAVAGQLPEGDLVPTAAYDMPLRLSLVTPENVAAIEQLAPFGVGNPSPMFLLEDAKVIQSTAVGAEGKHLKVTLQDGEDIRQGIAFSKGYLEGKLQGSHNVLFKMQINDFRGRVSAECMVRQIVSGSDAFETDAAGEAESILQDLSGDMPNIPYSVVPLLSEKDMTMEGFRGTLLLCRTGETAKKLRDKYPWMDIARGGTEDPQGFHTILYPSRISEIKTPFLRVVLCDGLLHPIEAGLIRQLLPEAEICALQRSEAVQEHLEHLSLSVEELREAYIAARQEKSLQSLSWRQSKQQAALQILQELKLLTFHRFQGTINMLPVKKIDPSESRLFVRLHEAKEV